METEFTPAEKAAGDKLGHAIIAWVRREVTTDDVIETAVDGWFAVGDWRYVKFAALLPAHAKARGFEARS